MTIDCALEAAKGFSNFLPLCFLCFARLFKKKEGKLLKSINYTSEAFYYKVNK
jgi:hypothetical protein